MRSNESGPGGPAGLCPYCGAVQPWRHGFRSGVAFAEPQPCPRCVMLAWEAFTVGLKEVTK